MPLPPSLSRPPSSLAWTMAVDSRWHSGSPLLPCSWVRNSQYQRGLFKIYHLKSSHYWDFPVVQWLRRACMLSRFSCVQLFATLSTVACQAPLSKGFSWQKKKKKNWSGLPCPPPRHLSDLGIEPTSLMSLALAGRCFTTSAIWETPVVKTLCFKCRECRFDPWSRN